MLMRDLDSLRLKQANRRIGDGYYWYGLEFYHHYLSTDGEILYTAYLGGVGRPLRCRTSCSGVACVTDMHPFLDKDANLCALFVETYFHWRK